MKINKKKKYILFLIITFITTFGIAFFYKNIKADIVDSKIKVVAEKELETDKENNSEKEMTIIKEDKNDSFENKVKTSKNNIEKILLVGVDTPDINKIKKEGPTGYRTDTIMILSIKDNSDVDIVSIPRDSLVYINGKQDKINHAHSFGGMDLLVRTIEDNFNITIDKYVRVDYKMIEEVTKDIGGVDVIIEEEMKYFDPTPELGIDIHFKPGEYNLQGKDAIKFLRYRSKEGDLSRVKNQQYFINQSIKKIYDIGFLKSSKVLLDNSLKYIDTNISFFESLGLINIGSKINFENISFHILKGKGSYINGVSYYIIEDFKELSELTD